MHTSNLPVIEVDSSSLLCERTVQDVETLPGVSVNTFEDSCDTDIALYIFDVKVDSIVLVTEVTVTNDVVQFIGK